MNSVILIATFLLGTQPLDCKIIPNPNGLGLLSAFGKTAPIGEMASEAKLRSCVLAKDFPYLVLAEIDLGESGTTAQLSERDLFVFDTRGKALKKVYQNVVDTHFVRLNREGKKEMEDTHYDYQLEKTKDGSPAVRYDHSPTLERLRVAR